LLRIEKILPSVDKLLLMNIDSLSIDYKFILEGDKFLELLIDVLRLLDLAVLSADCDFE